MPLRTWILPLALLVIAAGPAHAEVRSPGPGGDGGTIVNPSRCNTKIGGLANAPIDPGAPGPFQVLTAEYDFGDEVFQAPGFDALIEEIAVVHYPADVACGPFPIVFMMHGAHATCFNREGQIDQHWPCEAGLEPLPSYRGYDYLGKILASHGFVAVSISANAINGNQFAGDWNLARAHLFQRHMEIWEAFDSAGGPPFGNLFIGRIDLGRVGSFGHSRGGEGAMLQIGVNAAAGSPFGVGAVFLVGSTDSSDALVNGVPLGVLLPYCDGDQDTLPSVRYFDDARYNDPGDPAPKHTFLVLGANHDFYNTFWDPGLFVPAAKDDWENMWGDNEPYCTLGAPGNGRLTGAEQRGTAVALASAFFRVHLRGEKGFRPFLRGDAPPPPSAMTGGILAAYHPPDDPPERREVNRFAAGEDLATNALGGEVASAGLERFEWCGPETNDPPGCLEHMEDSPFSGRDGRAPHANLSNLGQARLAWTSLGGSVSNAIPAPHRDVSDYEYLQFRAALDFSDELNPSGQPQDLSVSLTDGAGLTASTPVSLHSNALYYPPSDDAPLEADTSVPRAVFNTVRVPLSALDDVFLTDVRSVRLMFDQTPQGAVNVSDLLFADEADNKTPGAQCTVAVDVLSGAGEKLQNVDLAAPVTDDHDAGLEAEIHVFSDEDDLDSAMKQASPDAKDIAPLTLRLRGETAPDSDGRVYLIVARATDSGGKRAFACTTSVVPAGNQPADFAAVQAQAASAHEMCTSFAAAAAGLALIPTGYFLVGDGPVIGQDQ